MSKVTVTIRHEIDGEYDLDAVISATDYHADGLTLAYMLPSDADKRKVTRQIEVVEE